MRVTPGICDAASGWGANSIVARRQNRQGWTRLGMTLAGALWLMAGCAPAPVRPPTPTAIAAPAQVKQDADVAIPALLLGERNGASARDLGALEILWAEDGQVHETRGTDSPEDDYHWQGRDAVLNRYLVAVFANPPAGLEEAPAISPTVAGDTATLVNGVDTWRFVRRDGRWWIQELTIQP